MAHGIMVISWATASPGVPTSGAGAWWWNPGGVSASGACIDSMATKIVLPCWAAWMRRTAKVRPVWVSSTSKSSGSVVEPSRGNRQVSDLTVLFSVVAAPSATAWARSWPPKIRG